jgi:hypothetical protein
MMPGPHLKRLAHGVEEEAAGVGPVPHIFRLPVAIASVDLAFGLWVQELQGHKEASIGVLKADLCSFEALDNAQVPVVLVVLLMVVPGRAVRHDSLRVQVVKGSRRPPRPVTEGGWVSWTSCPLLLHQERKWGGPDAEN